MDINEGFNNFLKDTEKIKHAILTLETLGKSTTYQNVYFFLQLIWRQMTDEQKKKYKT